MHGMLEDYRGGLTVDREADGADRARAAQDGRIITLIASRSFIAR